MGTEPAPASAYEDRPRPLERLALLAAVPKARDLERGRQTRSSTSCSSGSGSNSASVSYETEMEMDIEAPLLLHHDRDREAQELADARRWRVLARLGPGRLELVELQGANFGLRWRADARPRWIVGPHWYLMAATWTVFALLAFGVTASTAPMARVGETVTGVLLSTACLACYALVGCSDPGIVPPISSPPDESYSYCDQCDSYRPEGALHCMDCRVCIDGYDHHCPWTGKCVGRGNARYFYAWLLLLVLAFVYEVIEFTTYMLPPTGEPYIDSSDDSFDVIMPSLPPIARP